MSDRSYSTGQAAQILDVSQEHIRQLAIAGLIPGAFRTPGRQIRIPEASVRTLEKNGLPPLPRFTASQPITTKDPEVPPPPPEQSPRVLRAIEENLIKKQECEMIEQEVKILSAKVDREQKRDFLRVRDREDSERREQREAGKKRADCLTYCDQYVLRQLRWMGAPGDVQIRTQQVARQHFSDLDPIPERFMWDKILDSIIEQQSANWKQQKQKEKILKDARGLLPWNARSSSREPSDWELRAINAAKAAMDTARSGATIGELSSLSRGAVQPIIAQFNYVQLLHEMFQSIHGALDFKATAEELTSAKEAMLTAFKTVPDGTSRKQLEQLRDAALAPFRAAIAQRIQAQENKRKAAEEAQRMQLEAATKLHRAEVRATMSLGRVHDYLGELAQRNIVEFSGFPDKWNSGETIKSRVRPLIVQELIQRPDMPAETLQCRIDALVDKQIENWQNE